MVSLVVAEGWTGWPAGVCDGNALGGQEWPTVQAGQVDAASDRQFGDRAGPVVGTPARACPRRAAHGRRRAPSEPVLIGREECEVARAAPADAAVSMASTTRRRAAAWRGARSRHAGTDERVAPRARRPRRRHAVDVPAPACRAGRRSSPPASAAAGASGISCGRSDRECGRSQGRSRRSRSPVGAVVVQIGGRRAGRASQAGRATDRRHPPR